MSETFKIAIVGSGPSGLSAAAHAAELGIAHVLLESEQHPADTIYKYQKGKHVMAEPSVLPLRSPMSFAAGTREAIIGAWDEEIARHKVNIRHGAGVTAITGREGRVHAQAREGRPHRRGTRRARHRPAGQPAQAGCCRARTCPSCSTSWTTRRNMRTRPSWWSAPATRPSRMRSRSPRRIASSSSTATKSSRAARKATSASCSRRSRTASSNAAIRRRWPASKWRRRRAVPRASTPRRQLARRPFPAIASSRAWAPRRRASWSNPSA